MKIFPILIVLTCLIAGCGPSGGTEGQGAKVAEISTSTGGSGKTTTGTPDAAPAKELSADLQHDGYHWYGLANTKLTKYRATLSKGQPLEGTQQVKLVEDKDGKASYEITRTEGMNVAFGDEKISLEKDGVYTLGTSTVEGSMHSLELPSDLSPGKTWKAAATLKMKTGGEMTTSQSFKVIGMDKVKTPVAMRDALKITSSGDATINGVKYQTTNQMWYVKDFGLVKSSILYTPKTGKPESILIEELPR